MTQLDWPANRGLSNMWQDMGKIGRKSFGTLSAVKPGMCPHYSALPPYVYKDAQDIFLCTNTGMMLFRHTQDNESKRVILHMLDIISRHWHDGWEQTFMNYAIYWHLRYKGDRTVFDWLNVERFRYAVGGAMCDKAIAHYFDPFPLYQVPNMCGNTTLSKSQR
eukprot:UN2946